MWASKTAQLSTGTVGLELPASLSNVSDVLAIVHNFQLPRDSGVIPFSLLASSGPSRACCVQPEKNVISLYMRNC